MAIPTYNWLQAFNSYQHIPDILFVGILPDHVVQQAALPTVERQVLIHRKTIEHINERRITGSSLAKATFKHLSTVVTSPEYMYVRLDANRITLACIKTFDRAPVMVVIKLVPGIRSATGLDELWVSSAYPRSLRELRSMLKQGKLHIVMSV